MKQQEQTDHHPAHCDPDIWTLASPGGRGVGGSGYLVFDNSRRLIHRWGGKSALIIYNYFLMDLSPLTGSQLFREYFTRVELLDYFFFFLLLICFFLLLSQFVTLYDV